MDIRIIPEGFVWKSEWQKVTWFQALWFAIATGDWNRIHFNPFTWFLYKSNLRGRTVTGDMLLSLTKKEALEMVDDDQIEVVAHGYKDVSFTRPLHVGSRFICTYTLTEKERVRGKTVYHWRVEIFDKKDKLICEAMWKASYLPVAKSAIGKRALPVIDRLPKIVASVCLLVIFLGVWKMSKNPPPNDTQSVIVYGLGP